MDTLLSVSEGCSRIIARAVEVRPGYHDRASGPQVHLPGQWIILKHQGEGTFFKVLNPWIENAPQVSVIEDAEEWFVVGGDKEVRASQGEDTRMFQGPRECQCLTRCWGVITFCIVRKSGAGKY